MTPVLKKLEQKGYICRNRSNEDERVLIVTLTPEGEKLKEKAVEIPGKISTCISLDKEEALTMYQLLHKLLQNMEK